MHNPIDDLVKFARWLQSQFGLAPLDGLDEEQLRKKAEEWYENERGDEHG